MQSQFNQCPGCNSKWWFNPPVNCGQNKYKCTSCDRMYEIKIVRQFFANDLNKYYSQRNIGMTNFKSFEISKSYPYLSIARHYGLDYGKVLSVDRTPEDLNTFIELKIENDNPLDYLK